VQAIPIPPPIPIQGGILVPEPVLIQPSGQEFQWEPVPMYIENVPTNIPTPNPNTENQQQQNNEDISEDEQPADKGSGKPNETTPPLDLVPELAEVQTWNVPVIGVEIPVPRTEILVTATTTAGVSSVVAVGGTLFATSLFRQLQPILKPIFKTVFKKLAALRKKPPPLSWARERRLKKRRKELQ
jgi:hypothetical protein